jgi:hypothetical protein
MNARSHEISTLTLTERCLGTSEDNASPKRRRLATQRDPIHFTVSALDDILLKLSLAINLLYESNLDQSGYTITGLPMPSVM